MMTGRRIAGSGLGAGAAMSSGRPVLAADITSDPLWGEVAESATEADLVASWSIPIIAGPGAAVHGAIEVLRQWASLPSVAELEALCVLGRLAGGALDGRFDNQAGHPSGQRSSVAGGGAFGRSPTGELQPQRRIFRGLALLDMVDLRLRMTSDEAERHALILMDLDQFGRHNEALGLERGNALLDETAERLAACLEPDDLFGQLAGDTFAVLKTSIDGPEDASDAALRMVLALERPFSLEGLPALIRGSVGVAIAEASDDESGLDLLVTATLALEEAKAAGSSVAMRTGGVGGRSDGVLGGAGLDLAYQPMVHAEDRGLVGVEALVRLSHPDTGPAQPQIVIDEADDRGLALPVGQWVMRTSGAQIATRFETDPPRVWVNLSRRLFEHPELLPALAEINGMQGVAPLGVEFSERLALADPERTDELIERLGVLGVSSGVDDFGRDRSTYVLGRFDVDLIKLAPELTDLAVGGARGGTSVARLVDTARLLGVRVCAKGIESEAAAEVMAELGCDWLQGFALGEPTSVEDLPASK